MYNQLGINIGLISLVGKVFYSPLSAVHTHFNDTCKQKMLFKKKNTEINVIKGAIMHNFIWLFNVVMIIYILGVYYTLFFLLYISALCEYRYSSGLFFYSMFVNILHKYL